MKMETIFFQGQPDLRIYEAAGSQTFILTDGWDKRLPASPKSRPIPAFGKSIEKTGLMPLLL